MGMEPRSCARALIAVSARPPSCVLANWERTLLPSRRKFPANSRACAFRCQADRWNVVHRVACGNLRTRLGWFGGCCAALSSRSFLHAGSVHPRSQPETASLCERAPRAARSADSQRHLLLPRRSRGNGSLAGRRKGAGAGLRAVPLAPRLRAPSLAVLAAGARPCRPRGGIPAASPKPPPLQAIRVSPNRPRRRTYQRARARDTDRSRG